MKVISFFSGEGGFELAGEWMGWEVITSCEINPFGSTILKYYWPDAYHHDDVKTINYDTIRARINPGESTIFTAGFPCQPFSTAGKRKGTEDDRYGWPDCLRAIREIRPSWALLENVRGLVSWDGGLVFDTVQSDLEAESYEVLPFLLPACGVNAPHRRERIWFVAHANMPGRRESNKEMAGRFSEQSNSIRIQRIDTNPGSERLQGSQHFGSLSQTRQEPPNQQPIRPLRNEWQEYLLEPPICGGDDGLSPKLDGITFSKWRNESIKAHGNAVVPQLVYRIFEAIDAYEMIYD